MERRFPIYKKHKIIYSFGDAEVRRQSKANLPSFFREWTSVDKEVSSLPQKWNSLSRSINTLGHPPFDIFSNWLMDFATISAHQLGRTDWHNYRKMVLIHVPECPLRCWYCFNDAWEGFEGIKTDYVDAKEIVSKFAECMEQYSSMQGDQINILRISGGEPFSNPLLIADIAKEFDRQLKTKNAFLWVDTNLVPLFIEKVETMVALEALSALKNKAAIHACIHAIDPVSSNRNTGLSYTEENVGNALKQLLGQNLYPRINPVGLTEKETEKIFNLLLNLDERLLFKTYLGPIALLYEHAINRMKCFQETIGKSPRFNPPNVCIYKWNQLLESNYGVGYAKLPRSFDINLTRIAPDENGKDDCIESEWENFILLSKGWEKEIYAQKTLEVLGAPNGYLIEIELENKWVEPTLLAHMFSCSEFYINNEIKVLITGAYKTRSPQIVPLRWGIIKDINCIDCRDENFSINLKIELANYSDKFSERFLPNNGRENSSVFEYLSKYCGSSHLPFATHTSRFCQFVGVELLPEIENDNDSLQNAAFQSVILQIAKGEYGKSKPDVYYRIKSIRYEDESQDKQIILESNTLIIEEGRSIEILLEVCNPNMGNKGYPDIADTELKISNTVTDKINIAPKNLRLSKYGEPSVRVSFERSGEYRGELIFEPVDKNTRLASFRLPFEVHIRS